MILFLFFPQNKTRQFMETGDNLHEMTNPVFWNDKKKYFEMSSAEKISKSAKH